MQPFLILFPKKLISPSSDRKIPLFYLLKMRYKIRARTTLIPLIPIKGASTPPSLANQKFLLSKYSNLSLTLFIARGIKMGIMTAGNITPAVNSCKLKNAKYWQKQV
jgi:hypothetical protein